MGLGLGEGLVIVCTEQHGAWNDRFFSELEEEKARKGRVDGDLNDEPFACNLDFILKG